MRITNDRHAEAVYIQLTDDPLMPGRTSIPADPPQGVQAFVVLDWKIDRLVGFEVLDASSRFHHDFLDRSPTLIIGESFAGRLTAFDIDAAGSASSMSVSGP